MMYEKDGKIVIKLKAGEKWVGETRTINMPWYIYRKDGHFRWWMYGLFAVLIVCFWFYIGFWLLTYPIHRGRLPIFCY